jgi:GxxExxY protein
VKGAGFDVHKGKGSRKGREGRKGVESEFVFCYRVGMTENEISKVVLDSVFKVHTKIGPGILESIYEKALARELQNCGVKVKRQKLVHLIYDGEDLGEAVRLDLLVEDKLVVELKSVEALAPVHSKQVLSQLRLESWKLGLLINFGEVHLKNGIHRIVDRLPQ